MTMIIGSWPPPSMVEVVLPTIEGALKNHQLLSKKLQDFTNPPSGSTALFPLNAKVWERMQNVKLLTARLIANRKLLTELAYQDDQLRPRKRIRYGKLPSKRLQVVRNKEREANEQMKLDMESLFIFGNLLLEQWTYVIHYLIGETNLKERDFSKLVTTLQSKQNNGLLQPLWDNHYEDLIWLYYQLRAFRNIFIEHIKSPWQNGTSRETYGDSFRLATPSPVGWIDEVEIEKKIRKIAYLAPQWAKRNPAVWNQNNIRQLLEVIFYHIDGVGDRGKQEKVWEVWRQVGGWTPSYDMIAFRLMRFMAQSLLTMTDVITQHPEVIAVGSAPLRTSSE